MSRPSLDEIFGSSVSTAGKRPSLDEIFSINESLPQPDSVAKNLQQGMNPVKAIWTQVAQHPFKTTFQGIPKSIAGVDSGEAFIDRSKRTQFTPQQREEYKQKWNEYPSKENELGMADRFKATGLQAIDAISAPGNLLLNPFVRMIGAGVSRIPGIGNKLAEMALSPEFAQSKADFKYGHDARRVLREMPDVVGPDIHATDAAIQNKISETGQAIGDTMANHPNANVKINAQDAIIGPFEGKIKELNIENPLKNKTAIKRLQNAKEGLIKITDGSGNVKGNAMLHSMTPKELFDFRRAKIDKTVKFTGNASDDAVLNEAYQEARSNVRNILNKAMPELKPLNKDYGDLTSASDAIERITFKAQKEGLPGLGLKDIATLGITKWISNPTNKIKLAQWLYTAPKEQIAQASKAIPGFQQAVQKSFSDEHAISAFEGEGGAIPGNSPSLPQGSNFNPIKAQAAGELNHSYDYNKGLTKKMLSGGGMSAAVAMKPENLTLGVKNNNPINLKAFDKWDGMIGKDSFGHAQFKDLNSGIRAAYKNLKHHQAKHPTQSVEAYMKTFAEKNGEKEATFIAQKLGVSPKTSLAKLDMEKFLIHLAKFESKMDIAPEQIKKIKEEFKLK